MMSRHHMTQIPAHELKFIVQNAHRTGGALTGFYHRFQQMLPSTAGSASRRRASASLPVMHNCMAGSHAPWTTRKQRPSQLCQPLLSASDRLWCET